jgi:F0F1-type ATP synthase epsilon subunit
METIMKLHIIMPTQKEQYDVVWVELNTPVGSVIIQPEHAPTIITLQKGEPITFKLKTGKQESVNLVHGVAHVTRQDITIIAHAH